MLQTCPCYGGSKVRSRNRSTARADTARRGRYGGSLEGVRGLDAVVAQTTSSSSSTRYARATPGSPKRWFPDLRSMEKGDHGDRCTFFPPLFFFFSLPPVTHFSKGHHCDLALALKKLAEVRLTDGANVVLRVPPNIRSMYPSSLSSICPCISPPCRFSFVPALCTHLNISSLICLVD